MKPQGILIIFVLAAAGLAAVISMTKRDTLYREFAAVEHPEKVKPLDSTETVTSIDLKKADTVVTASTGATKSSKSAATEDSPATSLFQKSSANALLTTTPSMSKPTISFITPQKLKENPPGTGIIAKRPQYRPAYLASKAERQEGAKLAGVPIERFMRACEQDKDLHLASGAHPMYACKGLVRPAATVQQTPRITTTPPPYPLADTFYLHSKLGAAKKIYLDFTGHITTGTPWNLYWARSSFVTPPYSLDDVISTNFSVAEQTVIQEVWRRVAEDFAGFDVDVTTQEPSFEDLERWPSTDENYGVRVVIGPDQNRTGAGGVAFLGSFDYLRSAPYYILPTQCFVFADVGDTEKFISEAASHEVGHTVGLSHDGRDTGNGIFSEYFEGHGADASVSWAPIMGIGYYKNVVQWSRGEYRFANNPEDDLAIIASYIPLIDDDFGNTISTASNVPDTTNSITFSGIIGYTSDFDMIRFTAGKGNLSIISKVALSSPNLRLRVSLLDVNGRHIRSFEGNGYPGNMAPDPINFYLPKDGVYYLEMVGTKIGNGLLTGYTNYASLGYYTITANWVDIVNQPMIADATRTDPKTYNYQTQPNQVVTFNGTLSSDPENKIMRYLWDFRDVYPRSAEGSIVTHRYKAPGVYRPILTIYDDRGASASTEVVITVTGPTLANSISLNNPTGGFVRVNSIHDNAQATFTVKDQYGNPLIGAIVDVAVSGLVRSKKTYRTNALGQINATSPNFSRSARASVRFDVTAIKLAKYPYVPANNSGNPYIILTRP